MTGIRHARVDTVLGELTVTADGDAVTGVYFPGHWYPPTAAELGDEVAESDDALVAEAGAQLRAYLAGERDRFTIATMATGDAFQHAVWEEISRVPYGQTTTYGTIAATLGNPNLAQRVGQAVGHNPLSIIVPCHRVVGSTGKLTGYAGGLERKRHLLALESPVPEATLF
ncbi:methylated-DNA--[protein]-cysteine S-methyltransferase [Gryllotalpicola daejeonensis]|uniref:Methylated-DNA--protein-cysteine methyltransferase n=1 Tax=Gryllotalpicola daejeonensis TaxID=993087 RepID=A0ABP7ZH22_9MICO